MDWTAAESPVVIGVVGSRGGGAQSLESAEPGSKSWQLVSTSLQQPAFWWTEGWTRAVGGA